MSLQRRLALFDFLLREFGVSSFEQLAEPIRDPVLEQPGSGGSTRFHDAIAARLDPTAAVSPEELWAYDESIQLHTEKLAGKRPGGITWRYFQYVALLLTERFLDLRFGKPDALLADLESSLENFNDELPSRVRPVPPFERADLNKLAFWSATGSGKTLLMHAHLLQFRAHLEGTGRTGDFNRTILLTPNEGLSEQHLEELRLSGFEAEPFSDEHGSLLTGQVDVIDIHKLREERGEKSFSIDAFGSNNLVLVDEGHRGGGGEQWMDARDRLCRDGFAFEYSATFGQAFAGANPWQDQYAKWIAFEYSYRRFHDDGYGKDFQILNYPDQDDTPQRRQYLAAALLSFHQQQRYFLDQQLSISPFNIERPLWAFVGSSVNAVRTERGQPVSDVLEILLTLGQILADPDASKADLAALVETGGGILDADQRSIFGEAFPYLEDLGLDESGLWASVLEHFFNASTPGKLRVVRLRGVEGELGLQVGDSPYFGVVNVGDATKLLKLCEEHEELLEVDEIEASRSLFSDVSSPDSQTHLVVGAKKFIEGWNSWRVSSLGLMRVGRGEGPQIIQLFGRGVRLKGLNMSLKRSSALEPQPKDPPERLAILETLNVFGVRADYMTTFRDQLEEDGVTIETASAEIELHPKTDWPVGLKTIRLGAGADFEASAETVGLVPDGEIRQKAVLNWYARVESLSSAEQLEGAEATLNEIAMTPKHYAFVDRDRLVRRLTRYKQQRGWHTLRIDRAAVDELLGRNDWYELLVPPELVSMRAFSDVQNWRVIVEALFEAWCERRIKDHRAKWEQPHLRYVELGLDDPNVITSCEVTVPEDEAHLLDEIGEAAEIIAADPSAKPTISDPGVLALGGREHLYLPLLFAREGSTAKVKPAALNDGERFFVTDLASWCEGDGKDFLGGREVYLLRNQVRGKGIGFLDANNFHPDFLLWLRDDEVQRLAFVDPKGIVRLNGLEDPKIRLHELIKKSEAALGDPGVRLSSFIVSNTKLGKVPWREGVSKEEFEACHVFFQTEDRSTYIQKLIDAILADTEVAAAA